MGAEAPNHSRPQLTVAGVGAAEEVELAPERREGREPARGRERAA